MTSIAITNLQNYFAASAPQPEPEPQPIPAAVLADRIGTTAEVAPIDPEAAYQDNIATHWIG